MKVKYFEDTDTLYVRLSEAEVAETVELNENLYIDLDSDERVVSFTIEHARGRSRSLDFSYEVTPAGETMG